MQQVAQQELWRWAAWQTKHHMVTEAQVMWVLVFGDHLGFSLRGRDLGQGRKLWVSVKYSWARLEWAHFS